MTLLVFGRTGQVAREIALQAPDACMLGRDSADLGDPQACGAAIRSRAPTGVINAAAWTGVDAAEDHRDAAFVTNADAPGAMAAACREMNIPLVHISTDYVFDGTGTDPWTPQDPTGPVSVYGASKLAGEDQVRAAGGAHAILRTSWVFSPYGKNFVTAMLGASRSKDQLRVVADQIGGPTPARAIAAACLEIVRQLTDDPAKTGTYHFSGAPEVSWADFAREIFAQAKRSVVINDIPSSDYATRAVRPKNSRLDCDSTQRVFAIARPQWRRGLTETLVALNAVPAAHGDDPGGDDQGGV